MKKIYVALLTLFSILMFSNEAWASHAAGDESPTITCTGNNTYTIRWTFYRDCSGISAPTAPSISITSSCGPTQTVTLSLNTVTNPVVVVPGLCSTSLYTCNSGTYPGFEIYIYEGTVTLPPGCTYTITHSEGSRNPSTNYVNADFSNLFSATTFTTSSSFCNNTPLFFQYPIPYVCAGQQFTYNQGAYDIDGDSLVYSSIIPLGGAGAPLTPQAGVTANTPFGAGNPFFLNPNTGQMTFTCNTTGSYALTIVIDEYRNGVKIGSIMRNIQVQVVSCAANISPTNTGYPLNIIGADTSNLSTTNIIGVCPGQPVTFQIRVSDPNGDSLRWATNLAATMPNATMTGTKINNRKDSLLFTFTWIPATTDSGYKNFVLNVNDGACPVLGTQSFGYSFFVIAGTYAGPDRSYCVEGGPMTVRATGGSQFHWEVLGGGPLTGVQSISTPDSATVVFNPAVTTTYVVSSNLIGGCKNKDTITIFNVPGFAVNITSPDTSICLNGTTSLTANLSNSTYAPYTVLWTGIGTGADTTLIPNNAFTTNVKPFTSTKYIATVTSATGCVVKDTQMVVITGIGPKVKINNDKNYVCPGTAINLTTNISAVSCGLTPGGLGNACSNVDPIEPYSTDTLGTLTGGSTTATPFRGFWHDGRVQYIYRASELQAKGMKAGTITGLVYWVTTKSSTAPYNGFTVKMGCTNLNELNATAGFVGGLQTVVNPFTLTTNLGPIPLTFDNPYDWDGFSNIIVEVCFDNAAYTQYDAVYTNVAFTGATLMRNMDGSVGCTLTTPTALSDRPTVRFEMCLPAITGYSYQWTPTGTSCDTCNSTSVILNSNSTYSIKVTDLTTGCDGGDAITLKIDSAVSMYVTPKDTALCSGTGDTIRLTAGRVTPMSPTCTQTYNQSAIPYNALTGTATNVAWASGDGDEGYSAAITIPFTFKYFCTDYTQLRVSSNGFISLGATAPATFAYAQTIPSATAPNNVIALCWDDLDQTSGGTISYYTTGTAPNRVFVIKWTNVPHYSSTSVISGEIHLNETTNFVEIHTLLQNDNGTHTQGLENAAGTGAAATTGRNNTSWTVATAEGRLFTPNYIGSLPLTYQWSPVAPATATDANIFNPNDTTTLMVPNQPMKVAFQVQFSSGCIVRDTVNIRQATFPYTLSAIPTQICPGDSAGLLFTNTGTSPLTSVAWTPAAYLSDSTLTNPSASIVNDTKFFVTARNNEGCLVRDSITISTFKRDSLHLTLAGDTICPGQSVTVGFNDPSAPFSKVHWYSINPTYTLVDSNNLNTITFNQTNQYQAQIWENGCSYLSDTFTLFVATNPNLIASTDDTICQGQTATVKGNTGFLNYLWSNSSTADSVNVTTSGNYYYSAEDLFGCTWQSDTATIRVVQNPTIAFAPIKNPICVGETVILNAGSQAGFSYVWSTSSTNDTVMTMSPGVYNVTATNDTALCTATGTITVNQVPSPIVNLPVDVSLCGLTSTYTATPLASSVIPAGSTYTWTPNTSTTNQNVITATSDVILRVTDVNGCTDADTMKVYILPNPTINFAPFKNPKCIGESVVLNAGSVPGVTYTWNPGGVANTITVTNPATYSVTATVGACTATDNVTVTEVPNPVVVLPSNFATCVCGATEVVAPIAPSQIPANSTYAWSSGAGTNTSATISSSTALTLTVTDPNGCSAVSNMMNLQFTCLTASAALKSVSNTIFVGQTAEVKVDSVTLNGVVTLNPTGAPFTYSWTPVSTVQYPTQSATGVTPASEQLYTVVVTDPASGCTANDTIRIYTINNIQLGVATAFTPNGDGLNDVFFPTFSDPSVNVVSFHIYNEWNQLVYSQTTPWNGNYLTTTAPQPMGVYTYYISFERPNPNNPSQMVTEHAFGSFTLIR